MEDECFMSIHTSKWPLYDQSLVNQSDEVLGNTLIDIATAIRRYKSEHNLSLGTKLKRLQLATDNPIMRENLLTGETDLISITRAAIIEVRERLDNNYQPITISTDITLGIEA